MNDADRLPAEHAQRAREGRGANGDAGAARAVADYIAGMTDRFALQTRESAQAKS